MNGRATLVEMARHNLEYAKQGSIPFEDDVYRVPASNYYCPERWQLERDRVFKRMPLMLALTCEVKNPGDYKSMSAVDVPILICRGSDGRVRAFVNMCRHRGAVVMAEGSGNAKRFSCPYHAWSYDQQGDLVGIYAADDFGDVDKSCHGLVELPIAERAGLIWVILDPASKLDFDAFLSGYDELLDQFGFADWTLFDRRELPGPNWKIAYDGYMDLYHIPILHRNTFGADMPNRAIYYPFGPHQRLTFPDPTLAELEDKPEDTWSTTKLLDGVWTIFPHVSIASFGGGGRSVMISQLFPGRSPAESITVQNYVMQREPDDAQRAEAQAQFDMLEVVVRDEDYATGLQQQKALMTGAMPDVMFGRNEGGGHRFHKWVDKLIETDDGDLNGLFLDSEKVSAS
jgi:phenylpropionate dioxygenase-like ring-hydroxylating dioxygenase large terminal subunit